MHPLSPPNPHPPLHPTSPSTPPFFQGCRGGAVSASGSTFYIAGPSQFLGNNASNGYGGAIALLTSSFVVGPDAVNFTNNAAGKG